MIDDLLGESSRVDAIITETKISGSSEVPDHSSHSFFEAATGFVLAVNFMVRIGLVFATNFVVSKSLVPQVIRVATGFVPTTNFGTATDFTHETYVRSITSFVTTT